MGQLFLAEGESYREAAETGKVGSDNSLQIFFANAREKNNNCAGELLCNN